MYETTLKYPKNVCHFSQSHIIYNRNSLGQTTRDPQNQFLLSDVLLIRICLLHVHYYSKPNNVLNVVCNKQNFVLRVYVLMRFYCTYNTYGMVSSLDFFSGFATGTACHFQSTVCIMY